MCEVFMTFCDVYCEVFKVMQGHMFLSCPQTWLNEARTNMGLSLTMDFLKENDRLAYFKILGELSSGLSFTVGFSRL